MSVEDSANVMLRSAIETLRRLEQLRMQSFRLQAAAEMAEPCWEPPVDLIETEHEFIAIVALPGVDPEKVHTHIEGDSLVVSGRRTLPAEFRRARIHRLELPQGRFERHIALPPGKYGLRQFAANGCLVVSLAKL